MIISSTRKTIIPLLKIYLFWEKGLFRAIIQMTSNISEFFDTDFI